MAKQITEKQAFAIRKKETVEDLKFLVDNLRKLCAEKDAVIRIYRDSLQSFKDANERKEYLAHVRMRDLEDRLLSLLPKKKAKKDDGAHKSRN